MMPRFALAAMLLTATAAPALAAAVSEDDLRNATIQMEAGKSEGGQTVNALISCLKAWNPGDRRQPNDVEITRLKDDSFTVAAMLRSRSVFQFQVVREHGYPVALLQRVQYALVANAAPEQMTDAESKRAVLRGVCEKR